METCFSAFSCHWGHWSGSQVTSSFWGDDMVCVDRGGDGIAITGFRPSSSQWSLTRDMARIYENGGYFAKRRSVEIPANTKWTWSKFWKFRFYFANNCYGNTIIDTCLCSLNRGTAVETHQVPAHLSFKGDLSSHWNWLHCHYASKRSVPSVPASDVDAVCEQPFICLW